MSATPTKAELLRALQGIQELIKAKEAKFLPDEGWNERTALSALAEFYGGVKYWTESTLRLGNYKPKVGFSGRTGHTKRCDFWKAERCNCGYGDG